MLCLFLQLTTIKFWLTDTHILCSSGHHQDRWRTTLSNFITLIHIGWRHLWVFCVSLLREVSRYSGGLSSSYCYYSSRSTAVPIFGSLVVWIIAVVSYSCQVFMLSQISAWRRQSAPVRVPDYSVLFFRRAVVSDHSGYTVAILMVNCARECCWPCLHRVAVNWETLLLSQDKTSNSLSFLFAYPLIV